MTHRESADLPPSAAPEAPVSEQGSELFSAVVNVPYTCCGESEKK